MKHYPLPPIEMSKQGLEHYKRIIRQLDGLNDYRIHKAANLARLLGQRDRNRADEIELSIIKAEAEKLGVTV